MNKEILYEQAISTLVYDYILENIRFLCEMWIYFTKIFNKIIV